MNEACRLCVCVCRDKKCSNTQKQACFLCRGNPDGEGFHWLFTNGKQPHRQTSQFMVWIDRKQQS